MAEEKKCSYCAMMIPKEAKICPHCRKKMPISWSWGLTFIIICTGLIIWAIASSQSHTTSRTPQPATDAWSADNLPSFKIVGQDGQTTFSIVVPKSTKTTELTLLVMAFRDAKRTRNVQKLIPQWPNTGPALRLDVLIFNEPEWATSDRLRQFIMTSLKSKAQMAFAKQYAQHIRAHYVYSFADEEEGSIGYDDGMDRSGNYKQLFKTKT